jgi:DNA repair exonuclease SbcCD ATPase subunit
VHELLEEYRSDASRRALPTLEQETAALLAAITRGRYTDVRLSDAYALEVHDGGEPHNLRRFSGGEQDAANLWLRLALSRALARQRGTDPGFVILDEVLGSQDPDRRAALMGELRELTREFRQVFVLSHFADIADSCDIHLKVSRPDPPAPAEVIRG